MSEKLESNPMETEDSSATSITRGRKRKAEMDDELNVNRTAIELYWRKHGLSQHTIDAVLSAEKSEALPSINDPEAIEAFFNSHKRKTFRDLIPSSPATDGTIFGEEGDRQSLLPLGGEGEAEMSVKEALARKFTNYKVRLTKTRRPFDPIGSISYSPSSSANHEQADVASPEPTMNSLSINELLANSVRGILCSNESNETAEVASVPVPITVTPRPSRRIEQFLPSPACPPLENYPLPPFWRIHKQKVRMSEGLVMVDGVEYMPIIDYISRGSLIVDIRLPLILQVGSDTFVASLGQLLRANGIVINDPTNLKELTVAFEQAVFAIHNEIADRLLLSARLRGDPPPAEPVKLSENHPPFLCRRLPAFLVAMGKKYGPNEILDHSNFPSSSAADHEPKRNHPLSDKVRLLIVVAYDAGLAIDDIAKKFDISSVSVESVLTERDDVLSKSARTLCGSPSGIKQKAKENGAQMRSRRTTYGPVNMLMWRFFKECADAGIILNGKILKEHAMIISRQICMENFKGSEGWLDAFKRRHKIDLRVMTGEPTEYEEDVDDIIFDTSGMLEIKKEEPEPIFASSNEEELNDSSDQSKETPATFCADAERTPSAVASVSNTTPLDLLSLFGENFPGTVLPEPQPCDASESSTSAHDHDHDQNDNEKNLLVSIAKSASILIPDREAGHAIDVLRVYILQKDPSLIPLLVQLQAKLAEFRQ